MMPVCGYTNATVALQKMSRIYKSLDGARQGFAVII